MKGAMALPAGERTRKVANPKNIARQNTIHCFKYTSYFPNNPTKTLLYFSLYLNFPLSSSSLTLTFIITTLSTLLHCFCHSPVFIFFARWYQFCSKNQTTQQHLYNKD